MLFCSTILPITFPIHDDPWRRQKRECFCDRDPEWRRVHVWSISPTDEDGYMQLFPLSCPATFKRLSKREWLCFPSNATVRFLAYIIFSKRKLECDYFCVTVYTHFCTCLWFKNCTLFFYWEQKRYGLFTSELVGLFVYCLNLCHICSIIAWD